VKVVINVNILLKKSLHITACLLMYCIM